MRVFVAVLCLAGCGRLHFDSLFDNVFVVSTTQDRLDLGSGLGDLSLREALTIAASSPGSDLVLFDPDVFPAASPATIALTSELPVMTGARTVVDAGDAGVIVDVAPAYDGPIVRVEGAECELRGLAFGGGTVPRVVVSGTGITLAGNRFEGSHGTAITATGTDLSLAGNTILDAVGDGITLGEATRVTLASNRIERVTGDPIRAQAASGLVIAHNTIVIGDKTLGRGVRLEGVTGSSVRDNLIDPGPAQLVSLLDSSDNEIVGNVLDRGSVGVLLEGASQRNFVFRNVVIAPTDEAIAIAATATANRIVNNTYFQCPFGTSNAAPDTVEMNTLNAESGFVDPASYDFRLVGIEGVDRGVDVGQDMLPDSSARFLGAAPDLGAVETR